MKKGDVINLDLYQLYMAFVQEIVSRSIQYFRNNGEFSLQAGNYQQSDFEFDVADYLNDLLDYLLSWKKFKVWMENRHEA